MSRTGQESTYHRLVILRLDLLERWLRFKRLADSFDGLFRKSQRDSPEEQTDQPLQETILQQVVRRQRQHGLEPVVNCAKQILRIENA